MRISMKEIWPNLVGPSKNKDLWSYVVSFEFSRPKVAQRDPTKSSLYWPNFERHTFALPSQSNYSL